VVKKRAASLNFITKQRVLNKSPGGAEKISSESFVSLRVLSWFHRAKRFREEFPKSRFRHRPSRGATARFRGARRIDAGWRTA
jgi:hypothetical protein